MGVVEVSLEGTKGLFLLLREDRSLEVAPKSSELSFKRETKEPNWGITKKKIWTFCGASRYWPGKFLSCDRLSSVVVVAGAGGELPQGAAVVSQIHFLAISKRVVA